MFIIYYIKYLVYLFGSLTVVSTYKNVQSLYKRDWRKLHNEELHILYSSPNNVRQMWDMWHVWEKRGKCTSVGGKPEGKRLIRSSRLK
jgi:hypothetical protein